MTTQSTKKKGDGELTSIILMIFLLGAVLLAVNLWYSDFKGMKDTWLNCGLLGYVVLHVFVLASAIAALMEWEDPNYEYVRWVFAVVSIIAILYVGGFRAAKNEYKSVQDDSNKAKQEQSK